MFAVYHRPTATPLYLTLCFFITLFFLLNLYTNIPTYIIYRVKRQRYQHKLKQEGRHSTLTDERQVILNQIGFIWDSHNSSWLERYKELEEFAKVHGHANVPTNYEHNKQLSVWVKCQRRQYKLHRRGTGKSNMTPERIDKLEKIGFVWNPRGLKDF